MNRDALIRSLSLMPDVLEGFVAGLVGDDLDRRRGGGLWTVREHVDHLALVQPLLCRRIEAFRDEAHPLMRPHDPDSENRNGGGSPDIAEVLSRFRIWREKQVALLDSVEDGVWAKEGKHPEYDRYNLDILAGHIYYHDGFHLYRMEETAIAKDSNLTTLP